MMPIVTVAVVDDGLTLLAGLKKIHQCYMTSEKIQVEIDEITLFWQNF